MLFLPPLGSGGKGVSRWGATAEKCTLLDQLLLARLFVGLKFWFCTALSSCGIAFSVKSLQ